MDRVHEPRGYSRARQAKGHSETSTLSSQPSIDEVRQQMHMLLEEAFSLASAGHAGQSRHQETYGSTQHLPYSEVVTSAPGTMTRPRAGVQWVPTYRPEMYQYSLPRPVSPISCSPTIAGFALPTRFQPSARARNWCNLIPEQGFWDLGTSRAGVFFSHSTHVPQPNLVLGGQVPHISFSAIIPERVNPFSTRWWFSPFSNMNLNLNVQKKYQRGLCEGPVCPGG